MAEAEAETPKPVADKARNREITRRVIELFKPYKVQVLQTLGAVMLGVVLGLAPPLLLQKIIDDGLIAGDLGLIVNLSIWTVVLTLAGAGVTLLYGWLSVVMGQAIMCDLRLKLLLHLQKMSLRFFSSTRTGEVQTRMISDVQGVQQVLSNTLVDAVSNAAIVISSLVVMFYMDWRLTVLSIAMVPIFAVIGAWVGSFARNVRKGVQEQTDEVNSMIQETLSVSGILLTKTTGRLDVVSTKFDRENRKLAGWQVKVQLIQYLFFGMIRMITSLAPAFVYLLAGWLIVGQGDRSLTVGEIVAFTGLQIRMFFPITALLSLQVELLSSYALFDRLFQYLDLPPDVRQSENAVPLKIEEVRGRVEFQNVKFRYDDETEDWTINGVSFTAEPGQLVALVGPSGAGKTTLTYLIPRLYDAQEGSIRIDGQDTKDLTLDSLALAVGAVTQETYLLHASVRDNLLLARPDATQEQLEEACRMAAIHDHIVSLENGYDTTVGERGYKLSGGEKQRLAIARAILKNPRILILDEATSALDTRSERLIQESLARLMKGRTTFAIAHRLSTILDADLILVVRDGMVVESGRQEELLAKGGLFAELYNEQFRSQAERPGPEGSQEAETSR
ncbi:MAG: ABC transporter ATP-binding protein/permease [Fimbriimonadaceae bacterium]|nr:ABC transporter ATP-binding protein/permease [Fimbriimonadaceae bacterium]